MNQDLMYAMIERCRDMIRNHADVASTQPEPLRPDHLIAMCDRLVESLDEWSNAKMNRWIGFIQCAMIANRMIELEDAKAMFDRAKTAFGEPGRDLIDHLDPDSSFNFDLGGEG